MAAVARAQEPLPPPTTKRSAPLNCLYSGNLAKVPYPMLGDIAGQIGYEGIDLTVFPGGHVNPYIANVDMVRACETIRASQLELPMISTELTAMTQPTAYAVLALANQGAVPMFRTGYWPLDVGPPVAQRLLEVKRDIMGLVMLARRCEMETMIPNRAGAFAGHSLAQEQALIGDMDPRSIGYYFDIAQCLREAGPQNFDAALRSALPRAKAIAVSDYKPDPAAKNDACPLGEGAVDWAKVFAALAQARFTGPISVHMDYVAKDSPGAARKDLEFVRKQVQQAYSAVQKS